MSSSTAATPLNLILGCGYLGRRVATRWLAEGKRVAALTRRDAGTLRGIGVEPILGDVLASEPIAFPPAIDTILYAVGLDRSSNASMRQVYVSGLEHVLDTLPASDRFIYVSSTGVYGQGDGGWVDETSATEPTENSGKVVLEAEQLLRSRRPDAIILRFAGIYGPQRLLRQQAILAGTPLVGDAGRWLNLIHIDDGVGAVLAVESQGAVGGVYNIADDEPASRRDFYTLLAELLGAPPARFDVQAEVGQTNRRVSNARAKRALGWQPGYPSFRQGLPAAVNASGPF